MSVKNDEGKQNEIGQSIAKYRNGYWGFVAEL